MLLSLAWYFSLLAALLSWLGSIMGSLIVSMLVIGISDGLIDWANCILYQLRSAKNLFSYSLVALVGLKIPIGYLWRPLDGLDWLLLLPKHVLESILLQQLLGLWCLLAVVWQDLIPTWGTSVTT
jgi:hypothetical protein